MQEVGQNYFKKYVKFSLIIFLITKVDFEKLNNYSAS